MNRKKNRRKVKIRLSKKERFNLLVKLRILTITLSKILRITFVNLKSKLILGREFIKSLEILT